jgi:predicted PurR-regulated permease PerM
MPAEPDASAPRSSDPPSPEPTIDDSGDELVPGWLRRLAAIGWRVLVVLAVALVLAALAVKLSTVTASILFAGIVAATVAPVYRYMRDTHGWESTRTAAVLSVAALAVLALTVTLCVLVFVPYLAQLVAFIQDGVSRLSGLLSGAGVPDIAVAVVSRSIDVIQSWISDAVAKLVEPVASAVTVLILGGFLTFYLIQDGDRAWALAVRDLDTWRQEALTSRAGVALDRVGAYLRRTAIVAGTDAITDWLYLSLLGVPFAGPLAILAFLLGFVPYLGPVVVTSVLVLVTLAARGLVEVLVLLGLILATSAVRRRILARYLHEQAIPVHPALILIGLPAGAALFGIMGVIASVPIMILAQSFAPVLAETLDTVRTPTPTGALVPTWLDRLAQWGWRGLVVLAVVGVGIQAAVMVPGISVPVVLALVLAATLKPAVDRLDARGIDRTEASLGVTVVGAVVVIGVMAAAVIAIGAQMGDVAGMAATGAARVPLGASPVAVVTAIGSGLIENADSLLRNVAALAVAILLGVLLTFQFLRDGTAWWDAVLSAVSARRRTILAAAGKQSTSILNGYMVGTGTIALFAAVTQWLIMVLLGLPLAFPIGVLTFFGNFIPYIGGAVTTLLGFLVAVAVGDTTVIVLMAIYTLVINIVQGNFVAPLVYGRTVSLHPAIVLLAIPAGGQIAGIIGMFLIVPFLGVVATTWRLVLHLFDPDDGSQGVVTEEWPPLPTVAASAPVTTTAPG